MKVTNRNQLFNALPRWAVTLALSFLAFVGSATMFVLAVSNRPAQASAPNLMPKPMLENGNQAVNVLELFTSEGCSSCPPADALLPKLQTKYGPKLLTLSFHVDYWNRLGWTDPFSSSQFSARQSAYARALNATSYTPQAVINGSSHEVGGNGPAIEKALAKAVNVTETPLKVSATRANATSSTITVNYETASSEGTILNLALIQKEATISVKRGENGGRQLHHSNVVRSFTSVKAGNGQALLTLPKDLSSADVSQIAVVAYRQDAKTLAVRGGVQVAVR